MKATVSVEIEPKHAKTALELAGFDANGKSDKEICEIAIKMNKCYGVRTESIVWEDRMQEGKK